MSSGDAHEVPDAPEVVDWSITVDCTDARRVAAFWAAALGYVEPDPPVGYASWDDWLAAQGVPEDEWGDGAYLGDPTGRRPRLSFLRVPEPKQVKNRLHLDLQVSGGRGRPADERRAAIEATVTRLVALGGTVLRRDENDGVLDHVVLADPEGNELCVV